MKSININSLLSLTEQSASSKTLPAGLYLVATPIGNLRDITIRALEVLSAADYILCEDTRVTGKLLSAFDIKTRMLCYNDHNADKQRPGIIAKIKDGGRIALVSDAGTPLVSDPGYKLVRSCYEDGLPVTSLPGANAPLTALQLSGMPSDNFCFLGFLPPKPDKRKAIFKQWKDVRAPLIVFESAKRLQSCLADALSVLGDRQCAVVREMTKLYEESRRGPISDLIAYYAEYGNPKGEVVIVYEGAHEKEYNDDDIKQMLRECLKTEKVKAAAGIIADKTGVSKTHIYDLAIKMKQE